MNTLENPSFENRRSSFFPFRNVTARRIVLFLFLQILFFFPYFYDFFSFFNCKVLGEESTTNGVLISSLEVLLSSTLKYISSFCICIDIP